MATGSLKIHTENLLPIIKKWLYSDKDIFIRELVSNACDAIHKCRVLREHKQLSCLDEDFRIDLTVNKEAKTLTLSDNGIGMSAEEVEKYIAQVAFSGAEEFLNKYRSSNENDQIIGHFGLGFYSAYMVSSLVTIDTLSYKEGAKPALWSCDGTSTYTLDTGSRKERGTLITLQIDQDSLEFLEEERLRSILQRYCAFLPVPLYLNGSRINKQEPLWLKNPSDCSHKDYLDFYKTLYPLEPDPIFWIHLNVDYPFHLKGILYFPKITKQFEFGHSAIRLFCNRVFVSEHCKDLLPDYLMILRGALDSPDIPLNVSRSCLQMDRTVRQLASHISKKVTDRLSSLYTHDKDQFLACWPDIELIIKLGMLQDEKFYERAQEFLVWKNTSAEWTTLADYLERQKDKTTHKIFYATEEQKHSPLLPLFTQKGIEVLLSSSLVDTPLMNRLEDKLHPVTFQRIDGAIEETLLDASREKTLLDAQGKTQASQIASFIRSHLSSEPSLEVEAKSLHDDSAAAVLIIDEEMRRMKEALTLSRQPLPLDLPHKRTLLINTNNKLVQSLYRMQESNPSLAQEIVHHVYELALLSQKELPQEALPAFVARANLILQTALEHPS